MTSSIDASESTPAQAPDTPPAKFLAGVRGLVRATGEPVIDVIDFGLPRTRAIGDASRFRVGSLSKIFTAIGVLRLVQRGALMLEDELTTLIPEFEFRNDFKAVERVRVKHLLSHSSGLPVEAKAELTFVSSWPLVELLPLLADHPLAFSPGQRAQYSNVGYDLLGLVIERVSGRSFERYMHEDVFAPLGMTSAGYRADSNTVPGFFRDRGGALLEAPEQPANDLPAGGMLLSAKDFSAFLRWLVLEPTEGGERFLQRSLKQLMLVASAYRPLEGVRQQPGVPAIGCLAYCHVLPAARLASFTFVTGPFTPAKAIWEHHLATSRSAGRELFERCTGARHRDRYVHRRAHAVRPEYERTASLRGPVRRCRLL
jgi:CubicO group peptidase (beta-lactamase class C family)